MSRGRGNTDVVSDRVLGVAERLFAARGFDGVSIHDLTVAAGVSRPALYYHFGSKQAIYAAAVRWGAAEHRAVLETAAAAGATIEERIRRTCLAHAVAAFERRPLGPAVDAPQAAVSPSEFDVESDLTAAQAVATVGRLVREGVADGTFAACEPEDAACALVGAAEVCAGTMAMRPEPAGTFNRLERVVSLILRGLSHRSVS